MWQLVMAGASLLSGISEGKKNARKLARQAAVDEFEARGALEEADEIARQYYAASLRIQATQVAEYAASNVVVNSGSVEAVMNNTEAMARQDALAALYTGGRQAAALRASASNRMSQRDDAKMAGLMKGIAGAAGHVGGYMEDSGSSAGNLQFNNDTSGITRTQAQAFAYKAGPARPTMMRIEG